MDGLKSLNGHSRALCPLSGPACRGPNVKWLPLATIGSYRYCVTAAYGSGPSPSQSRHAARLGTHRNTSSALTVVIFFYESIDFDTCPLGRELTMNNSSVFKMSGSFYSKKLRKKEKFERQ